MWNQQGGWPNLNVLVVQDLIIPSFRAPDLLLESPLLGFPPKERNILLFFRGKVSARMSSAHKQLAKPACRAKEIMTWARVLISRA